MLLTKISMHVTSTIAVSLIVLQTYNQNNTKSLTKCHIDLNQYIKGSQSEHPITSAYYAYVQLSHVKT